MTKIKINIPELSHFAKRHPSAFVKGRLTHKNITYHITDVKKTRWSCSELLTRRILGIFLTVVTFGIFLAVKKDWFSKIKEINILVKKIPLRDPTNNPEAPAIKTPQTNLPPTNPPVASEMREALDSLKQQLDASTQFCLNWKARIQPASRTFQNLAILKQAEEKLVTIKNSIEQLRQLHKTIENSPEDARKKLLLANLQEGIESLGHEKASVIQAAHDGKIWRSDWFGGPQCQGGL